MVRRSCVAPRQQDNMWLRTNIFKSTYTIKGYRCTKLLIQEAISTSCLMMPSTCSVWYTNLTLHIMCWDGLMRESLFVSLIAYWFLSRSDNFTAIEHTVSSLRWILVTGCYGDRGNPIERSFMMEQLTHTDCTGIHIILSFYHLVMMLCIRLRHHHSSRNTTFSQSAVQPCYVLTMLS